jgi:hypothetical protein
VILFYLFHHIAEVDEKQLEKEASIPSHCPHDDSCNNCWKEYPQSRFPNWTEQQVRKSKIHHVIRYYRKELCTCHRVDVGSNGLFANAKPIIAGYGKEDDIWRSLITEEVIVYFVPFECAMG